MCCTLGYGSSSPATSALLLMPLLALVPICSSPQVQAFAAKMYNLGGESMLLKRSSAGAAFKDDLAAAVARAFGARSAHMGALRPGGREGRGRQQDGEGGLQRSRIKVPGLGCSFNSFWVYGTLLGRAGWRD